MDEEAHKACLAMGVSYAPGRSLELSGLFHPMSAIRRFAEPGRSSWATAANDPFRTMEIHHAGCIKYQSFRTFLYLIYAVPAASSSPDYSQKSARKKQITSRFDSGHRRYCGLLNDQGEKR
jgi:hypothetical protein